MTGQHRISAGAIVIRGGKILLVRYRDGHGKTYLVGPGGGVGSEEGLTQAISREVKEETSIEVAPTNLLCVDDLYSHKYRMVKIWFLCRVVRGRLKRTRGAVDEGIVEAGWYSKADLENETVYPPIVKQADWTSFAQDGWHAKCLEITYADF